MEGPSNGGLLYHEVQESKLCAVHCVNTVLQGPFFTELDLAALASDLDQKERQVMIEGAPATSGDFLSEDSHNVSMDGDFSLQVMERALEVWDLKVIPLDSPAAQQSKLDPELENAYICHLQNHWFCIRKVNGEWYNFNSLYAAPEHLTKFYLSAYMDTLKGSGWSIFLVRGNFPTECPISSSSNAFGQWLTPEDAKRITKSCNQMEIAPQRTEPSFPPSSLQYAGEGDLLSEQEQQDLHAAIQASLMDAVTFNRTQEQKTGGSGSTQVDTESSLPSDTRTAESTEASSAAASSRTVDSAEGNDSLTGSASAAAEAKTTSKNKKG